MSEHVAVSEIIKRLKDIDSGVRYKAVRALLFYGEEAVPLLIEALEDQDSSVRETAAWCLGRLGSKAINAIESLKKLTADTDKYVKAKSEQAIKAISSSSISTNAR